MTDIELSPRQTTLTLLTALLIATAGCTTGIGENPLSSEPAKENTETETAEAISPEEGRDLRTISIDKQFGEVDGEGELDGTDPRQENKIYEPVEFLGQKDRYYNITMKSYFGNEEMRLIGPDDGVVAVATGNSTASAKFELVKLNKTGNYTIEATSVEERETFTYTLTVNEVKFAGSLENYGEFERYSRFGQYTEHYWNEYHTVSDAEFESVNTSEDYVVIEYERPVDANETLQSTNTAIMARTMIDTRNWIANEPEGLQRENPEKWYPERVYFKGYDEDGELVETNYVSQRWTAEYMAGGNEETRKYFYRIVGTTKYGPAHNKYDRSAANETIDEDTFPYPTYPEEYEDFPTE